MKKLLLILVFLVVGMEIMAQEGNVMVRHRSSLCFVQDNKKEVISDDRLLSILGENNYGSYCAGKSLYRVGDGLVKGGWISFAGGAVLNLVGEAILMRNPHQNQYNQDLRAFGIFTYLSGIIFFAGGCAVIPPGYILRGVGCGKISRIADEHNQNSSVSYFLSPSLIPVNMPQTQNNLACGVAFSVSF